jgi:hypothetical protein
LLYGFGQKVVSTMTIRTFFNKVKVIPYGFKRVFQEMKVVTRILKSHHLHKQPLNRHDNALVRQHFAALRKLSLFFLIQIPPGIGYIAIAFALRYPRQNLTHHFFDNNPQKLQKFLRDEFLDRNSNSLQLLPFYPSMHRSSISKQQRSVTLADWHNLLNTPIDEKQQSIDDLSHREYISLLAKSNMICDSVMSVTVTPSLLLRYFMSVRAKEVVQDDLLLLKEGIDGLSVYELQQAALRRGFRPVEDEALLKSQLHLWLQQMMTTEDRNEILSGNFLLGDCHRSKAAALFHLMAFNTANFLVNSAVRNGEGRKAEEETN